VRSNPREAPFGVYESGIFSGDDERTEPRTFHLERTESEKDGSVRVYVRLTLGKRTQALGGLERRANLDTGK